MTGGPRQQQGSSIDAGSIDALQNLLRTVHAALWSYTLALAFLPNDQAARARQDVEAHRQIRSQIEQTLTDLGARPVSAQPAYATPEPVKDAGSAARLAVTAEADVMGGWRSLMEHTTDASLRTAALNGLTAATGRAAVWRGITGTTPVVPVFPGVTR